MNKRVYAPEPVDDWLTRDGWEEGKHKRGQPKNRGQFGPGGGGAKTQAPAKIKSKGTAAEGNYDPGLVAERGRIMHGSKTKARAKTPLMKATGTDPAKASPPVDPKQTSAEEAAMEASINYSKSRMMTMAKRDKMGTQEYVRNQLKENKARRISLRVGRNLSVDETYITQEQFDYIKGKIGDADKDAGVPVTVYPGHSFVTVPIGNGRDKIIKPMGGFMGRGNWAKCKIEMFADELLIDEMINSTDITDTVKHEMQHARFEWATRYSPNRKKITEFIADNMPILAREDGTHPNAADYWQAATSSSQVFESQELYLMAVNESLAYNNNPIEPDQVMTAESHPTYMKLQALIDKEWSSRLEEQKS